MRYLAILHKNKRPVLKEFVNPDPGDTSCHIFKATGDVVVTRYDEEEFQVKLIACKAVANESLYGPASLRDKTLVYPCEFFKCRVGCPCKMCRNKLSRCEDFKDHEAYHKANHTMCQFCANLESVIPHFHYKIETVYYPGFEKVYNPAMKKHQFVKKWFVRLGSASLFHHRNLTQNPQKINSVFHCDKCE